MIDRKDSTTERSIIHTMDGNRWLEYSRAYLANAADVFNACDPESISEIAEVLINAFRHGNKLLIAGNGGSAADALHLAAEFVNRLTGDYERPALPAIALTCDVSVLTSIANDYGFERVFVRHVEALGRSGDVLMLISTSGSSQNCLRAAEYALDNGITVIAVTGGSGGQLAKIANLAFVSPTETTQHVQEAHLAFYHMLVAIVERELYASA